MTAKAAIGPKGLIYAIELPKKFFFNLPTI